MALYILYIFFTAWKNPKSAPAISKEELKEFNDKLTFGLLFRAFVLPMVLILSVLGSIFSGIASPTEAAGVGARKTKSQNH